MKEKYEEISKLLKDNKQETKNNIYNNHSR